MQIFSKIGLLVFFSTIISCQKNEDFLLEMSYKESFSINAGLNPFKAWYFNIRNIRSNKKELLATKNISTADITKINPGKAHLYNILGDANYGNIKRISVRIFLDDENDFKEIFYREDIPLNTKSDLDLIATLVDLKDWISNDNFNIVVRIEFRTAPPISFENQIEFSFLVI